jgi:Na+-driven multidrug efflux pump
MGVSVYGIINRMMMFANFPVLGITQGFLPIASYNYGAQNWDRVKEVIKRAIIFGTGLSLLIFIGIMFFAPRIPFLFTDNEELIQMSSSALRIVFLATPLLTIQLIGSAYFQAIGKALPALVLSLLKQGIFLIPLVLILPSLMTGDRELQGVWYAFPIADTLTAIVNLLFLRAAFARISTDPMKAAQSK